MNQASSPIVLVTGAAAGIGLATARIFADRGATVVLADRDADALMRAAQGLGDPLVMDVSDEGSVRAGVAQVVARYGAIDVLVNNAGIVDPRGTAALDLDCETVERLLRVNLTGSYMVARDTVAGATAPSIDTAGFRMWEGWLRARA